MTDPKPILDILAQAADIREQHNRATCGLYRLPDELIVSILRSLHCDQLESWYTDQDEPRNAQRWWDGHQNEYHLAHRMRREFTFCRRVRAIATRTPELWTFSPLGPGSKPLEQWRELCLVRASGNLLELYVALADYDQATVDKITLLSHRARELHLLCQTKEKCVYASLLSDMETAIFAQRSWPMLTSLIVEAEHVGFQITISSALLAAVSATLVALEIRDLNAVIDKHTNFQPMPCLEHLSIRSLRVRSSEQLRMWLSTAPALRSIDITLHARSYLVSSAEHVPLLLPRLRSAKLCGNAHLLSTTLSFLPVLRDNLSLVLDGAVYRPRGQSEDDVREIERSSAERIIEFWRKVCERQNGQPAYRLALSRQDHGAYDTIAFTPIFPPSRSPDGCRIHVTGYFSNHDALRCFAQVASTLEILAGSALQVTAMMLHILQAPNSIETVRLYSSDANCGALEVMEGLEGVLWVLKDALCPLKTLIVDASASPELDELKRRWVDEGLIRDLIMDDAT